MKLSNNKPAVKQKLRVQIEETASLTDEEFEYIFDHFEVRSLKKHDFVIQQGFSVPYDFWVAEGCLKAHIIDNCGKEHILQFAKENSWISDYEAHFNEQPATFHINCIEDCVLLTLTLDSRRQVCRMFPKLERFLSYEEVRSMELSQR